MSDYGKWLGGGLGWLVGGPIGGILGFVAGNVLSDEPEAEATSKISDVTELESCLIVLASHVINADGKVSLKEIDAVRKFFVSTEGERNIESKMSVLNHCLNHQYELEKACGFIRIYQSETIALQTLRLMFDIALCDADISLNEQKVLARIARLLSIHDVVFKEMLKQLVVVVQDDYTLLNITKNATQVEIRNAYRKMVLHLHPDRNSQYTDAEKKSAERKLQELREAYKRLIND
jgi:DnaJ like chaperone protein